MSRFTLLCLACLSVVVSSRAYDYGKTVPDCEKKSSDDIYFDFSNRALEAIQYPFVSGPSVKCINLEGNLIETLEREAFDGLPELIYLNLARNPIKFENFSRMSFGKLETLVLNGPFEPQLRHNPLSEYDRQSELQSHGDYNSDHLYSDGTWRELDNQQFVTYVPNLKKLSLRNYGDESVLHWLSQMSITTLTHLYIDGNRCTDLPLRFTDSLTYLNADDNDISYFAKNYRKLQYLSMDRNKIENVCSVNCNMNALSLRYTPSLEYLSLIGNNIASIEPDAFQYSDKLQILNLDMNRINHLPWYLFDNLTSLKNLSLAKNSISEIPHTCRLVNLEILNLSGNEIRLINPWSFCDLSQLKFVDLSHNGLKTVADQTFGLLSGLRELDLSWNDIKELSENWIGSNSSLDVLNLEGNKFTHPADMSLGLLERFRLIHIAHNPMNVPIQWLVTHAASSTIDVGSIHNPRPLDP